MTEMLKYGLKNAQVRSGQVRSGGFRSYVVKSGLVRPRPGQAGSGQSARILKKFETEST